MNKAFLLGRLTKDPEIRYTPTGKVVCQFTLAVDRPFANQEGQKEADFINIILWGKSAEQFGNTVRKGQRILVEGRIQTRSYEAKDKTKRYITEVVAERFEYIEKRDQANNSTVTTNNPGQSFESIGSAVDFDEQIPF